MQVRHIAGGWAHTGHSVAAGVGWAQGGRAPVSVGFSEGRLRLSELRDAGQWHLDELPVGSGDPQCIQSNGAVDASGWDAILRDDLG